MVDFSSSSTFSVSHGSPYVQLGMAIVEEIIVVILYAAVGMAALRIANPEAENLELSGDNAQSQGFILNNDKEDITSYAGRGV